MKQDSKSIQLQNDIEQFINAHPDGFTEFELMRHLEQHNSSFKKLCSQDELTLFKKHFLIRNALYKLQQLFSEEREQVLMISAVKISLSDRDSSLSKQQITLETSDSNLRSYYLDWNNLINMDQASVETLLDDFWVRFFALDKRQDALDLLGLKSSASEKEIKTRFKYLAAQHHPDKGGSTETFIQIRAAYETLNT